MNYFAHLVLAQPTIESTVGNLLGDFARGIDKLDLPLPIRAGLDNHRAVDRFTDTHPVIRQLKTLFSSKRRRFAGIALDVYFDHLLMKYWAQFDTRDLQQVIEAFYQRMVAGGSLMPNQHMQNTTQRMVDYDWFGSYRDIDSVAHALNRIASRIRFANQFDDAIEDILSNQEVIEQAFLIFFPELRKHISSLAIESRPSLRTRFVMTTN